jgi:RNA polymerase sigma-70 factor (ECF subfamily)
MFDRWLAPEFLLARWVAKAKNGDRQAFERIYRALFPAIEKYVAHRVRERDEGQDIVATCFLNMLDRLDSYDARRGTVRMWAFGIVRNLVTDYFRRSQQRALHPMDSSEAALPCPNAFEEMLGRLDNHAVREALSKLDNDSRELLSLRFGEGLKHGEIAQLLNMREDAVRQKVRRVMNEVRQHFDVDAKSTFSKVAKGADYVG